MLWNDVKEAGLDALRHHIQEHGDDKNIKI